METSIYLQCFVAGLAGIIFHLLINIQSTRTRAKVANVIFDVNVYLKDNAIAIATSLLTLLIFIFVIDEIIAYQPVVKTYFKLSFVFVGYAGSSVLTMLLGKAQDKLNDIVNRKTDIADAVEPPPPPPDKV